MPNTNTPEQSAIPKPFEEAAELASLEYKVLCKVDRDNGHRADHDFSAGAEWAYRHLGSQPIPSLRWVDFNISWPGNKRNVLISHSHIAIGWYDDNRRQFYDELCGEYVHNVTHWAEMPEQPSEESLLPVPQEPKWNELMIHFTEEVGYFYEIAGGGKGKDLIWEHVENGHRSTTAELLVCFLEGMGMSPAPGQPSIEPDAAINDQK